MLIQSSNNTEVTIGIIFCGFFMVLFALCVHFRCNDINGKINRSDSIKYIFFSCIPIISLFVIIYLLFAKGEQSLKNDTEKNLFDKKDNINMFDIINELQDKYQEQLIDSDEIIDTNICNDLYIACNKIFDVKQVVIDKNIGLNDIIKFYRDMKSDDVLWDDDTGKYLPFVAILNAKTLSLFSDNKNLPASQLKKLIITEMRQISIQKMNIEHKNSVFQNFFGDAKKIWILFFLIVSICMMIYPPYHKVVPNKGDEFVGYSMIGTFPEKTTNASKKFISVDYATLAFHEIILAVTCCAGYMLMTVIRKK